MHPSEHDPEAPGSSRPIDTAHAPAAKPLRRDAERNRQLILQAARELFAERGIAVTLDDVAARAGVGVGTVYRRFPSRDAIVDELFVSRIDEIVENARRSLELEDPWASVVQLFEGYMVLQAGDRSFGPVILTDAHGRGALDEARVKLRPIVAQIVERAQQAGVLRTDFEATDVPMIILMVGTLQSAVRDVAPDAWRRQLAIILDGLRPSREGVRPFDAAAVDAVQVPHVMSAAFLQPGRS